MEISKKIDLGCGENKPEGFYGVDLVDTSASDKVIDLDKGAWDLPSNYFQKIRSDQVFEHLQDPFNFFNEIYRIAEPGARVVTITPHSSSQAWQAPDHQRLTSFEFPYLYLAEEGERNYRLSEECAYEVINSDILFSKRKMFFWNYLIEPIVNLNFKTKQFYERTGLSRIFPAQNLYFELEVKKD